MENAESLVNKTAEIHEFASEIVRMITGAQMPEFSSENMSVADASKLIGLPAAAIRAGIVQYKKQLRLLYMKLHITDMTLAEISGLNVFAGHRK